MKEIKENCRDKNVPIIIVGTKNDIQQPLDPQLDMIKNLSLEKKINIFLTSSKLNTGINDCFENLIE